MDNFDRRKENLKRVLTCGICKKLYKNVTIIEECCHRFCKNCITKKIIEEKLKECPECNQDLGVVPLQKIRPDHQMQGIRDELSRKRREFIERGLIQKFKKDEPKKLAREDIDLNNSADMLIDNPPSLPHPPPPLTPIVATSSRRKQKSIASLVNTTPLVIDDQVLSQQNIWNSSTRRGRGRGRGRGRRSNSLNDANDISFQDSSKFVDVIDLNNEDTQPGNSKTPLLSDKDSTQHKQQVKSSVAYVVESSKENKSIESLDGMNELWKPLKESVTKDVTMDNSNNLSKPKKPVPKFIRTPVINLDDYEDQDDINDDDDDDEEYVPFPTFKDQKVSKQRVDQKLVIVQAIKAPSIHNTDNEKAEKGRRGRKKKERNNPTPTSGFASASTPAPAPAHAPTPTLTPAPVGGDSDGGDGAKNNNLVQVGVTTEASGGTNSGNSKAMNERFHPIWFNLVVCDKQECPSPLPQISSRYIMIKDVNIPVSYIKKYLVNKLGLQNEDEVEIRMLGMPIRPSLPLKHLAELWLRVAPNPENKLPKVGASAQDFVMVLKYSRSSSSYT